MILILNIKMELNFISLIVIKMILCLDLKNEMISIFKKISKK